MKYYICYEQHLPNDYDGLRDAVCCKTVTTQREALHIIAKLKEDPTIDSTSIHVFDERSKMTALDGNA